MLSAEQQWTVGVLLHICIFRICGLGSICIQRGHHTLAIGHFAIFYIAVAYQYLRNANFRGSDVKISPGYQSIYCIKQLGLFGQLPLRSVEVLVQMTDVRGAKIVRSLYGRQCKCTLIVLYGQPIMESTFSSCVFCCATYWDVVRCIACLFFSETDVKNRWRSVQKRIFCKGEKWLFSCGPPKICPL